MSTDKVFSEKTADFALDLFRQVAKLNSDSPETKNLVLSPTSITVALALAQRGAKGKTRQEIGDRLFGNLKDENIEQSLTELSQLLNQKQDGFILNSANRLFVDEHFNILDAYLQESQRVFQAAPENLPFSSNSGQAVQRINSWVNEKTNGKISSVFDRLDNSVKLIIANAIYFKGDWAHQFQEEATQQGDFHVNGGKNVAVQFMNMERKFDYAENDEMQLLALPYVNEKLQMVFILPKERFGLTSLEKSLTGAQLWQWIDQANYVKVNVKLPKFKIEASLGLVEALQQLGMTAMFSPAQADFSAICKTGGLCVSDVIHKAFIEVNEKGAEAAAVTAIIACGYSLSTKKPELKSFHADQPFLFAILEKSCRTVLFFGQFYSDA